VRVLLTGGTGYLGRAIARALVSRGHDVVVFSRHATGSGVPGTPFDGDVRKPDDLRRAADGCEGLVHNAALVSIWQRRREDFDDVNVGGLQNAIAAARAAGISRFVYTSSFLARPPHGESAPIAANDYQRTKVAADAVADAAVRDGSPLVRVYPGVVYGPGTRTEGNMLGRLIADHLKGRLPALVGADMPWSFAYVDDVAAGHCEALLHARPGSRYALGGENQTPAHAFEIVSRLTGRRAPGRMPYGVADALGLAEECRVALFGGTPLVTRGAVEIFRHDWSLDSADAARDLHYTMTPLDEGIRRTLASFSGLPRRGPTGEGE
jgi:farnesol dehydrogenase